MTRVSMPQNSMKGTRATAAHIVGRVLRQGAYSNVLVGHAAGALAEQDRATLARLVYGTIRNLRRIDRALGAAASRPLSDIQSDVLDVLRVGAFELLLADTPDHAAVAEAVEAVRSTAGERPVGFANAVLRNLAGMGEPMLGDDDPGLVSSVQPWQFERLASAWGREEAEAFLVASMEPPAMTVAVRSVSEMGESEVGGISGVRQVEQREVGVDDLVADPASVAVVNALDLSPEMDVLDVAAAPGGKTIQIADRGGRVVAMDRHHRRASRGIKRTRQAGVDAAWIVGDGRRPPFTQQVFDRVLVDAPCTGFGTLRRRPEIKHRLDDGSPARMALVQSEMLDAALQLVRPGGKLVYSVCTVFPEETSQIAGPRGGEAPDGLPGRIVEGGLLLAPHITGTDGMFISVFEVSE